MDEFYGRGYFKTIAQADIAKTTAADDKFERLAFDGKFCANVFVAWFSRQNIVFDGGSGVLTFEF